MKRVVVLMGGTPTLYKNYFRLFDIIEKEFNCVVSIKKKNRLLYEIDNVKLEFLFCLHPIRDRNYVLLKELKEGVGREVISPPADELVKDIGKCDSILFFGLCGAMKGKTGDVYLPTEFIGIYFDHYIWIKEVLKIRPSHAVSINNTLLNTIKGQPARVMTTNITLLPDSVEGREEGLLTLSGILSVYGDIVDKESYQVAKYFANKVPCGFALMASDLLSKRKQMMRQDNFTPDIVKFNAMCVDSIKQTLKDIN